MVERAAQGWKVEFLSLLFQSSLGIDHGVAVAVAVKLLEYEEGNPAGLSSCSAGLRTLESLPKLPCFFTLTKSLLILLMVCKPTDVHALKCEA